MRVALAGLTFFALALPARADTWVPADPPADEPVATAAPDGTAVIVDRFDEWAPISVSVRPPGGTFRPPVQLGTSVDGHDAAVAPGGWVAVAWADFKRGVHLTVFAPDGRRTDRRLSRAAGDRPAVGIDAAGRATVAWLSLDGVLHSTDGLRVPDAPTFDVAVSASGRRLVTWGTEAGVQARVDDAPPQPVAPGRSVLGARIADDGAALIATVDPGSGCLRIVDRAAGMLWSAPHDVSGGRALGLESRLVTALAADGRAVVAWGTRAFTGAVFGVVGRPGGVWEPATRLSSPLRGATVATVNPDLRVLWGEDGIGLRGARPIAGAVRDTAPLGAELTLPKRLRATRDGRLTITATARCAKACEVGLSADGGVYRTLAAGQTATLRLALEDVRWLYPRNARRLRVTLGAADRYGQARRVPRTYRVRVIRPPLRSFRVGPSHDFELFTAAGNRAVGRLVNALIDGLADRSIRSERELVRRLRAGAKAIEAGGHDEVYDTAVREAIAEATYVPFALRGYSAAAAW